MFVLILYSRNTLLISLIEAPFCLNSSSVMSLLFDIFLWEGSLPRPFVHVSSVHRRQHSGHTMCESNNQFLSIILSIISALLIVTTVHTCCNCVFGALLTRLSIVYYMIFDPALCGNPLLCLGCLLC